jgi:2-keto-3-deoxygluconate permease
MIHWLRRIPGSLMIVPLLLGAILSTIDRAHFTWVQQILRSLGAAPVASRDGSEVYEFLQIGGFATALTGVGATTLIAMFLVCVTSQMNFRIGGRAVKKGLIITTFKFLVAVACGYALAITSDPFEGWLGLSLMTVIAAMSNTNGGLYLALTGMYGDRSDMGAISVISLNNGPFLTLLALGMLGERFPIAAFLGVLAPMVLGFCLGQASEDIRRFLAPGEKLCIPFFAFALGTTMNLGVFLDPDALLGGAVLGISTVAFTGTAATIALRLLGERTSIAGFAAASTAGNAIQTPLAVAVAARLAGAASEAAIRYEQMVPRAMAQISVSVIVTAVLCPFIVAFVANSQATAKSRPALIEQGVSE